MTGLRNVVGVVAIATLVAMSGAAHAQQGDDAWIERVRVAEAEIASKAKGLPAGTVACDFGAWSTDMDPKGLNVRAEPSAKAKVLHRVPPPVLNSKSMAEAGESAPMHSDFRVLGYRDGWFLIDRVRAASVIERTRGASTARRSMRGWVSASHVGGGFANGDAPGDRLYETPDPRGTYKKFDDGLIGGVNPKRLLACNGGWVQVELVDGQTGWFRTICWSQMAICN